jgi:hypothetical protein
MGAQAAEESRTLRAQSDAEVRAYVQRRHREIEAWLTPNVANVAGPANQTTDTPSGATCTALPRPPRLKPGRQRSSINAGDRTSLVSRALPPRTNNTAPGNPLLKPPELPHLSATAAVTPTGAE